MTRTARRAADLCSWPYLRSWDSSGDGLGGVCILFLGGKKPVSQQGKEGRPGNIIITSRLTTTILILRLQIPPPRRLILPRSKHGLLHGGVVLQPGIRDFVGGRERVRVCVEAEDFEGGRHHLRRRVWGEEFEGCKGGAHVDRC